MLYRPGAPADYVAYIEPGAWLIGWGWTAGEALHDLAMTVAEDPPRSLTGQGVSTLGEIERWIARRAGTPELDDWHLVLR